MYYINWSRRKHCKIISRETENPFDRVNNNLEFLNCACRFTEKLGEAGAIDREGISKRYKCKALIKELKKDDDLIDINIFRSFHRVNLSTIIGYHQKGEEHSFLDTYDDV